MSTTKDWHDAASPGQFAASVDPPPAVATAIRSQSANSNFVSNQPKSADKSPLTTPPNGIVAETCDCCGGSGRSHFRACSVCGGRGVLRCTGYCDRDYPVGSRVACSAFPNCGCEVDRLTDACDTGTSVEPTSVATELVAGASVAFTRSEP